ncbi:MAG: hypothetical protein KF891_17170 [Rhizobacter sp.]|nr:hypothetical protein [Rhizobacter sp.]
MKSTRLAPLALVLCSAALSAALPAHASSTAASSASEGVSASVGSASDSFETSSDGSSKNDKTAAGDYKVVDVAEVAERPGTLRMTLQPVAAAAGADRPFVLYVPAKVMAQTPVAAGEIVTATPRPYGVEFAKGDTGRPFYLVLQDTWYRELQSNAVTL